MLAAVETLHCGFAVTIGIALTAAARDRMSKVLCLLWGPAVCVTVIATGNHHAFDVATGLAVTVAGYAIGRAAGAAPSALPRRDLRRRRAPAAAADSVDTAVGRRAAGCHRSRDPSPCGWRATAPHEIAETVGIERSQLDGRFAAILAELAGRATRRGKRASSRAHVA